MLRFMGREQIRMEHGTPHERLSERGCVEDQPQWLGTFEKAAAGALSPRTQTRSGSGGQCAIASGNSLPEEREKCAPSF